MFVDHRVYPRACGGTARGLPDHGPVGGLSPRLRGNGRLHVSRSTDAGSIPALAGERLPKMSMRPRKRVYPRACGGTCVDHLATDSRPGLSPRLRGNASQRTVKGRSLGSIPALAGERRPVMVTRPPVWVYPRACGGTAAAAAAHSRNTGLSPRLRGNVFSLLIRLGALGSIPALAGERVVFFMVFSATGVYPRACGGTRF